MSKTISPRSKATLKVKLYMLTVQKHKKTDFVSVDDLLSVFSVLHSRFPSFRVGSHSYEVGNKYHQLHFHGLVTLSESFYYKRNCSINGFHLQWRPLYNKKGALSYIFKDTHDNNALQDNILITNKYTHPKAPYAFTNL